ncbi:MAG TPA: hypothetical protein VHT73_01900 [Thermodesulfobacteriota bacterium]|nr:hypothetical protein [Thermodesulfobacteriota bacterium]
MIFENWRDMMEIEMLKMVMNGLGLVVGKRQMQVPENKAVRVIQLVLRGLKGYPIGMKEKGSGNRDGNKEK